jgi:hypothetical protein
MAAKKKPPYCPGCGTSDINAFYLDKNGNRVQVNCKECHKKICRERWSSMTPLERKASRASMYGLTPEQFLEMYHKQEGKCAICKEPPTTERGLHIDHCHETKIVRGLLCHGCNTGIGSMKENISILKCAISYLGG